MELTTIVNQLTEYFQDPYTLEEVNTIRKQLSPSGRDNLERNFSDDYRESGVLILLYPKNSTVHFVLIERKSYDGVHSGQISLPGGGYEDEDIDLARTALRECFEEIGVSLPYNQVLGQLHNLPVPVSGYVVSPFVAFSNSELSFSLDSREVQSIFEVNLDDFLATEPEIGQFDTSYGFKIKAPFYPLMGHQVWGATAMILAEFKAVLLKQRQ